MNLALELVLVIATIMILTVWSGLLFSDRKSSIRSRILRKLLSSRVAFTFALVALVLLNFTVTINRHSQSSEMRTTFRTMSKTIDSLRIELRVMPEKLVSDPKFDSLRNVVIKNSEVVGIVNNFGGSLGDLRVEHNTIIDNRSQEPKAICEIGTELKEAFIAAVESREISDKTIYISIASGTNGAEYFSQVEALIRQSGFNAKFYGTLPNPIEGYSRCIHVVRDIAYSKVLVVIGAMQ